MQSMRRHRGAGRDGCGGSHACGSWRMFGWMRMRPAGARTTIVVTSPASGRYQGAMPYQISWEAAGVVRRFFGDLTIAERRASLLAICHDERFDELRFAITDYRAVQAYECSQAATMEIAAMHIGPLFTNPSLIIAAVTDRAEIVADIQHFMALGIVKAPYRVFASMDEARRWTEVHPRRYG